MSSMWKIFVIVIIVLTLVISLILFLTKDKVDKKDVGGTQLGGNNKVKFFSPANEKAGAWGEKNTNKYLDRILLKDEYLLSNLLFPLKNGYKTEIDTILVTRKGIFCIEIKYWVGHISGNDEDEFWFQTYDDRYRGVRKHKNPVKQNLAHAEIVERASKHKYHVENCVVFAQLEDGRGIKSEYAFSVNGFQHYFRMKDENVLTVEEIEQIKEELRKYLATSEELELHRKETQKRFH